MIGEIYYKEFMKDKNAGNVKSTIDRILAHEEMIEKNCIDWNTDEIKDFLKGFHSVSPNTLSRGYSLLKNFIKHICIKEGLPVPEEEQELQNGVLYDLVDWDKIIRETITPWDYMNIKNQLDYNIRDKVTFELAWNLLTMEEIRFLKESDIEFVENPENGLEIAYLNITDTKVIKIENPEEVEDIKQCMKEQYYNTEDKNGISKRYPFRDSEYLVKPTVVGKAKNGEEALSNPSNTLKNALIIQGITCEGIDVGELNVESIRRSRLVYLLTEENKKYFDMDFIKTILDAGEIESNLFWLQDVAKVKYKK